MRGLSVESRLPLMAKELVEQSARARTYAARAAYALVVFGIVLLFAYRLLSRGGEIQVSVLVEGHGRRVFEVVVWAQVAGIFLFLPAMLAGALTREREASCLDLLLLTGMRPWDIVLQKLLSRVVPMATCLTVSFPLLAVSLAYGGVTQDMVWSSAYVLLLTALQAGALSLALAADAPTTSSALLNVYVRLPLQYGVLLAASVGCAGLVAPVYLLLSGGPDFRLVLATAVPFFALAAEAVPPPHAIPFLTFPAAVSVLIYLRLARDRLLRALEASPAAPPRPSYELVPVPRERARRSPGDLPGDAPVAWRELSSRLMVKLQGVFVAWMLCAFLLPLPECLVGDWVAFKLVLSPVIYVLWAIAATVLALLASGAFTRERSGQTLGVLLATPIPTRRLVLEKLAGARRCAGLAAIPFAIACVLEALNEAFLERSWAAARGALLYLAGSAGTIAAFLLLALWLGAWIGLRVRDRGRAILLVLLVLSAWTAVAPFLLGLAADALAGGARGAEGTWWSCLKLLSPATVVALHEGGGWRRAVPGPPWLSMSLAVAFYLALALAIRGHALRSADRWLGRVAEPRSRAGGETTPSSTAARNDVKFFSRKT